jgi:hypothetical protein
MSQVARTLIVFGVALVVVALLVHVVAALLAVALPLGLALIIAGAMYHLVRPRKVKD